MTEIEVRTSMDLRLVTGDKTETMFDSRVKIKGNLTARERTILLNSAHHCDVHKILLGKVTMHDRLQVDGEESLVR